MSLSANVSTGVVIRQGQPLLRLPDASSRARN
jgi:hypothetical protein